MAYSPASLLSYVALTKSVEDVKTGIPDVLPPAFWTTKESITGDAAEYVVYKGTRRVAPQTPAGAPARTQAKEDIYTQKIKLISSKMQIPFTDELMTVFRQWERYEHQQKWAADQVAYASQNFRQQQDNLRNAVTGFALSLGAIYFGSSGNLLPSSSGASLTIDQNVPSGNKTTVGGIISASWATSTTDIITQINNLDAYAAKISGYPLKYALYGKNVAGYIAANATCQAFLARNYGTSAGGMNEWILRTGQIPAGFLGKIWVPVQNMFYEDSDGTNQDVFPTDQVTFTPDINATTYCMFEGSTLVPQKYGPMPSSEDALASLAEVTGMYRYAKVELDPVGIYDIVGDCFLPRLRTPKAYFLVDTTP